MILDIDVIDERTLNVSYRLVSVLPKIQIKVKVENVDDSLIVLSYDCPASIGLMIKGGLLFLQEKLNKEFVDADAHKQRVSVHLNGLEQLKSMFEYLMLSDVCFIVRE